ncbi:MAG: hypothetical protein IJ685_05415 [Selenomonadaceae bacterium]|nr:hypothetical protein [Selenomonadaceae bacterium]
MTDTYKLHPSHTYRIREVIRPDGRKIWRIVEVLSNYKGEVREEGRAALDSFPSAKKFLSELNRRYAQK